MVADVRLLLQEESVTLERLEGLGRTLALALRSGDVVLFYGPLGAGKTAFVRAVARALDVTDPVRSPSFTIANIYAGRMVVQHLDLYRLDEIGDDDALALEDYVDADAVTLVEWPQAGAGRLGRPRFIVTMDHQSLDERRVQVEACGPEAEARWHRAAAEVAAADRSPADG